MPAVTRADLQKSIEAAKNDLGIDATSSVDKLTLNRVFKRKINLENNPDDSFWAILHQSTFLLLTECVALPKEKTEDFLYAEMVEQARLEDGSNTIQLELHGLHSVCHARLCNVLLKRFPQASKPRNIPNITIKVENICIPYNPNGRGLVVPPICIRVQSLSNSIKLSIDGESGMIFVLYHLQKILHTFLGDLPVKIEDCYTFPSQSSCASVDAKNDDMEDEDVLSNQAILDGQTSPIIMGRKSKTAVKSPGQEPGSSCSNNDQEEVERSNVNTADNLLRPEINNCSLCALISIAENIVVLVRSEEIDTTKECNAGCLEESDSMEMLVGAFINLVVDLTKLNVRTLPSFKKNFKLLSNNVLSNAGGAYKFYCMILEKLMDMEIPQQNRIVRLLNEITDACIDGQVKEFEDEIVKSKLAKRNLTMFLYETGAIHSIHAVLQLFHKMHNYGVNISLVLPSFLNSLVEMFKSAPRIDTNKSYHHYLKAISSKFIRYVLKERNIAVIDISKKTYLHEELDAFVVEDHIYFDKISNRVSHFLDIGDKTCSQCIPLQNLMYCKEDNTLENEDWKFFLTSSHQQPIVGNVKTSEHSENAMDCFGSPIVSKDEQNDDDLDRSDGVGDGMSSVGDMGASFDSENEESKKTVIEAGFIIEKQQISRYWNPVSLRDRKFHANLVGGEWPAMYKSVCPIVLEYNRAKVYKSRKRNEAFAKVIGICTICSAVHTFMIKENPFEEILGEDGMLYIPKRNMNVDVEVEGKFLLTDGKPDIEKPVHLKEKSRGRFCKGRERELMGKRAAQIGPVPTYLEQFDYAKDNELKFGNRTSIRSLPVIKGAKAEEDKKVRGGSTHYESAKSAKDLLAEDIESPNFPMSNASKDLPGIVRSLQEVPFKITIANFDMLRVGGHYMNKVDSSIVCLDSSGKYWQEKNKAGKNLLNSALVIPPIAKGLTPFPIFEMVSQDNKTLDFIEMLQRAWGHMATAMSNTPVKEPSVSVTDLSFPNLHAMITVFNKVKLPHYLEVCFKALMNNEDLPFPTIVTICESHLIPILLRSAREIVKDKIIADTCAAGLLLVLRAPSISRALQLWEQLVMVHVSKNVNEGAREFVKRVSKHDVMLDIEELECMSNFDDKTPDDELAYYGDRKSMRKRSPFFTLFMRAVTKVETENENIDDVSNELYAPKFFSYAAKQFLSLYPFITAALLEDGLLTNAHVELHWKSLRAQMSKISKSQQWPSVLLGQRHQQTRRQAKEILIHSLIPNLKFGGKTPVKKDKHANMMQELGEQCQDKKIFRPTSSKKRKKMGKINDSFDGSRETWGPKIVKAGSSKKDNYMKGKTLDHAFISSLVRQKAGNIRVTGNDDEAIILTKQDVDEILSDDYISDAAVGAGLLLLDKRINDVSNTEQEKVKVYSIPQCSLILTGMLQTTKSVKFITILPRHMALSQFTDLQEAKKEGKELTAANGGHFTLVSNLFCSENECNVFETFGPYRSSESLLTSNGKRLLRYLCNSGENQLKVKCIDVNLQEENECGAIAFGLALQLCFYYHEGGLNTKFKDVRKHLLSCLKENALVDFPHSNETLNSTEIEKVLFSINI